MHLLGRVQTPFGVWRLFACLLPFCVRRRCHHALMRAIDAWLLAVLGVRSARCPLWSHQCCMPVFSHAWGTYSQGFEHPRRGWCEAGIVVALAVRSKKPFFIRL